MYILKDLSKYGIKNGGEAKYYVSPTFGFYGNSEKKSLPENIEQARNTTIPNYLQSNRGKIQKPILTGHDANFLSRNVHAQSVFESMRELKRMAPNTGIASLDIESFGLDYNAKNFMISEIGISQWQVGKNLALNEIGQGTSLVGIANETKLREFEKLVRDIRSGAKDPYSLTPGERTELRNLLKYSNENGKFKSQVMNFGGISKNMNVFEVSSNLKLPEETFNPKIGNHLRQMEDAISNLRQWGNKTEDLALALNTSIGSPKGLLGHNLLHFDLPALATVLGENTVGKNISKFFNNVEKRFVIDTLPLLEYAFPNLVTGLGSLMDDDKYKLYRSLRNGQLKNEVLSHSFGIGQYTHTALADSRVTAMIFNQVNGKVQELSGGVGKLFKKKKSIYSTKFLAMSGLNPYSEIGEFDGIYNSNNERVFQNQLTRNATYSIESLERIGGTDNPYGHKYGSNIMVLRNEDDDLRHVIVRPENAAGTGIDDIRSLFSKHLIELNEDTKRAYAPYLENDKAMRNYRKLFEYGGYHNSNQYEKTKAWYRIAAEVDTKDLRGRQNDNLVKAYISKVNMSDAQKRDFLAMRDRLAKEQKYMMNIVFQHIDASGLDDNGKQLALINIRNVMEGRDKIEGINIASPLEKIKTTAQTRALMMDNGILMLGGGEKNTIRASLNALSKSYNTDTANKGIMAVVNELRTKGYITQAEYNRYSGIISKTRALSNNDIVKELMTILSTRTKQANQLSSVTIEDNIKAAKMIVDDKSLKGSEATREAERQMSEWRATRAVQRDFTSYQISSVNRSYASGWTNVSSGIRHKIIKQSIERARVTQNLGKYGFDDSMTWMNNILQTHTSSVSDQISMLKDSRFIKGPTDIRERLNTMIGAYTRDKRGAVKFVNNPVDNMLHMVLFSSKNAASFENLTSAELLNRQDAVLFNIPLADKNGLLRKGSEIKLNRTFLGANFKDEALSISTGVDRILNAYTYGKDVDRVLEAIASGNAEEIQTARNFMQTRFSRRWDSLSGTSLSEIEDELKYGKTSNATLAALKQKRMVVDISGVYTWLQRDPTNPMHRMNIGDELSELLGQSKGFFNMGSLKEKQAEGTNLFMGDIRNLHPFGEFSPTTSQIMSQSLGMEMIDASKFESSAEKARRLAPILTTNASRTWYDNGFQGGMNLKTAYIAETDASILAQSAGLKDFTLHDGSVVMSKEAAKYMDMKKQRIFMVDELDDQFLEAWKRDGLLRGQDKITIGTVTKAGIKSGTVVWDKKQDFHIDDVIRNPEGRFMVSGHRILEAEDGFKTIDNADKGTAGLFAQSDIDRMLPGRGVEYIKHTNLIKKGMWAELLTAQSALMMREIETVGGNQTEALQQKAAQYFNEFFNLKSDGFKISQMRVDNYLQSFLVVPENLTRGNEFARFQYEDFKNNVLLKMQQDIRTATGSNYNILDALGEERIVDGKKVNILYGITRAGGQMMEPWQKAAGFNAERGMVQVGPKFTEFLTTQGLTKTRDFFRGEIKDLATEAGHFGDTKLGKRGMTSQLFDALENLATGRINDNDVFIRTQSLVGKNDISISAMNKVLSKDYSEPITPEMYRGTIHDFERMAKEGPVDSLTGGVSRSTAQQIVKQGSVVLELPEEFKIGGRMTNQIRLMTGDPRKFWGSEQMALNDTVKQAGKVMTAVQEFLAGGNIDEGRAGIQWAISKYEEEVAKATTSSRGFIYKEVLSGRMKGSGNTQMAAYDLSRKEMTGVIGVSEEYFNNLFAGHSDIKQLKSMASMSNLQRGGEGVYALAARAPYTSERSGWVGRLVIDNSIKNDRLAKISAVDAIRAAGDFDADTNAILVTHYKEGSEAGREALAEMKALYEKEITERKNIHDILFRDAQIAAQNNGQSVFSIGNLSTTTITSYKGFERASSLARIIRSDIGHASNFNTYVRRIGETLVLGGSTEFTAADQKIISNIGELIEQNPTSGKHSNYRSVYESFNGDFNAEIDPELHKKTLEALDNRITVGKVMRDAFVDGDKKAFFNAADELNLWKNDSGVRQRFGNINSIEEMEDLIWGSRDKLFKAINSKDYSLKKTFSRGGFSSVSDAWAMLTGNRNTSINQLTLDVQGLLDIPQTDIDAGLDKFIADADTNMKHMTNAYASNFSIGDLTKAEVAAERESILKGMKGGGKGAAMGALAFGGLMMTAGFAGGGLSDKVDHNIPIGEAGYAPQIPVANPPGPQARVTMNGSGYEGVNVTIRAKDLAGMSEQEVGAMIRDEVSGMMPMDVTFNISKKDNSQKLDSLWVQNVMSNAVSKGYAF